MKKSTLVCGLLGWLLALLTVQAQTNLVITSFHKNGMLTWSNLMANSTCHVEWASSPDGLWTNTWDSLNGIPTGTNATLSAYVPMFYRVVMFVPPTTYDVDWCRLQWPLSESISTGEEFTVYGRVYVQGLTDKTDGVDPDPSLIAEAGYGPDETSPDGNPAWVWSSGGPTPGWSGAAVGEPHNDEYMTTLSVSQAGTYDFAARFSSDGGSTWTYGDRDAGPGSDGSEDGYQSANAGALTVTP